MPSRDVARKARALELPGGLRKRPLQQRSKAAIRRVLDVAAELVLEHGAQAVIGSPTLLLEKSGISRGSFYAFFETPERVLDELALQCILDSRDEVRKFLDQADPVDWRSTVDAVVEMYWGQFRIPLIRELWVTQDLSSTIRSLDRLWVEEYAELLFHQFQTYAPKFERLTTTRCLVALETLERLAQCAFRDDPDGDEEIMHEAHALVLGYFESFERR